MIGIDLTKKSRFAKMTEELAIKFLHPNEIKIFKKAEDKLHFLATRWAIKEAIFKCDNQYKYFSKIDVEKDNVGRYVFKDFEISTTDDDDYIVAVALKNK